MPSQTPKYHKSLGVAILLTCVFGPIGLFYASISGGLIMTLFGPAALLLLFINGLLQKSSMILGWSLSLFIFFACTYWIISVIWATISVQNYNRLVDIENQRHLEFLMTIQQSGKPQVTVNFHHQPVSGVENKNVNSIKPTLDDWLKENPGKTVNDYFSKFRQ